jgi:hypothetical protein
MTRRLFFMAAAVAVSLPDTSAQQPWYVELQSLVTTESVRDRTSVIADFELQSVVPAPLLDRWTTSIRNDGTSPEIPGLWGTAWYFLPSGDSVSIAVRTFPDAEEYERNIDSWITSYGDDVKVRRVADRVSMFVDPGLPPTDKSLPRIVRNPLHSVYREGIKISSSSEDVFLIPVESLKNDINAAAGKQFFVRFDPNAVPESVRREFVSSFSAAAAVEAQGRDGEQPETSRSRKSAFTDSLSLLKSILFDIDDCVLWLDSADQSGAETGFCRVRARDDTQLAELIGSLRSRSPNLRMGATGDAVAVLSVNATLPPVGRELLARFIQDLALDETGIEAVLLEEIRTGSVELCAAISTTEHGDPQLSGALYSQSLPVDGNALAQLLVATPRSDGHFERTCDLSLAGVPFGVHQVVLRPEDALLNFAIAREHAALDRIPVQPASVVSSPGLQPLATLSLDLSPWIGSPDSASTTQFLKALEQTWALRLMPDSVRPVSTDTAAPRSELPSFVSVTDKLKKDDDWKAGATLSSDETTVVASWRIGGGIARWKAARKLLALGSRMSRHGTFRSSRP